MFVVSGLVPNRKSHPLVYEWIGVTFRGERFESLTTFDDVIERTGLGGGTPIANRELPVDVDALARLRPAAVEEARRHVVERRNRFESVINAKLDEELKRSGEASGTAVRSTRAEAGAIRPAGGPQDPSRGAGAP